jgi:hypothetical protein
MEAVCRKTPQEVNPDCAAEDFVKNYMSYEKPQLSSSRSFMGVSEVSVNLAH